MKITFIGTSHGVPEANRRCTCVMLTVGGRHYIIDAGVMLCTELRARNVDLKDIKAIFITHMHGDHTDGLVEFTDLLTWYFKDVRPEIYVPEIKAFEGATAWLEVTHGQDMRAHMPGYSEVAEGAFYDDGVVKVTAIRTRHLKDRPSYGYMVEAEGKRVVFSGDMGLENYADFPYPAYTVPCDVVVTEAAHFHLAKSVETFKKFTTGKLIVSHVVPWNEPEVEQLAEKVDYEVVLAYDGMTMEI